MATFTGVKKYQDFCRRDVMDKGYILLNALTGHRAHIYDHEILKGIKSRLTPEFYAIRRLYKGKENPLMPKPVLNQLCERFAAGEEFSDLSGIYTYTVKKGEKFETKTTTVTEADVYMYPPKHYFRRKSASEKQSINYRIQGTGALCFKIASIRFYNWLIQNNLLFTVLYTVPVHDKFLLWLNLVNCWKPLKK